MVARVRRNFCQYRWAPIWDHYMVVRVGRNFCRYRWAPIARIKGNFCQYRMWTRMCSWTGVLMSDHHGRKMS